MPPPRRGRNRSARLIHARNQLPHVLGGEHPYESYTIHSRRIVKRGFYVCHPEAFLTTRSGTYSIQIEIIHSASYTRVESSEKFPIETDKMSRSFIV